ncbi:phosphoribosylglycinamide formyltransferase [Wenxinia marina]|uniref:Phosphoribosylglycinamide formyltransferase n=1 Tax=Wenxinia marina DSM 24838 TaxID=1123501 RepID=A0A0D0Q949_9RHOB|nr:phosphoribosylglycinamide formyltransferase [Wenxinia marina]KIQ68902.1 formyltetrahydrofolate-dependent phosphoribosylglycinamide formyltransferase [Wenxinia marina DSM 24838]GGL64344.1 phosphoribosylglycinamide formyltransferase [Wenxinia marina]
MRKRTAILISGSGSNMARLVEDMADKGHPAQPVLVVSNVPEAGGLAKARRLNVPTFVVDHRAHGGRAGFEAELDRVLRAARAEIVCLAGFMRVLSGDFVAGWEGRMLNIHPSLLPRHRGLDTHARALAEGDARHGCTVHEVTAALDDGPVLGQASLDVIPGETPEALAARVLRLEHRLYPAVLRRFAAGDTTPVLL